MCPRLANTTRIDGVFLREEFSFGSYCSTEQGHVVMSVSPVVVNVANSPMDVQCGVNESGESGAVGEVGELLSLH